MSTRLEDYALIGDCETAALVSRAGSIDWLCWPRFDSPACFAALLGDHRNGRWLIDAVDDDSRVSRRYQPNTLILETEIVTSTGAATVIDFMPPRGSTSDLIRIWVNHLPDGTFQAIAGPNLLLLHTPVHLQGRDLTTVAEFEVVAGQSIPFVLTHEDSHLQPLLALARLSC